MRFLLAIVTFMIAAKLSADTTLNFAGKYTAVPEYAYTNTLGQNVSFTVVLSDNPLASQSFPGFYYYGSSEQASLFSSITGNVINGALSTDSAYFWSNTSYCISRTTSDLFIFLGMSNGFEPIGLYITDGGESSSLTSLSFSLNFLSSLPSPGADYSQLFNGMSGTYALSPSFGAFSAEGLGDFSFEITSFGVNAPSVPEPSTYGLVLGGLSLIGTAIFRRRQPRA